MTKPRPKRASKPRKPLYFTVERLVRPDTGEAVGCLVPANDVDRRAMRERGYRTGSELRAELKKPRNVKFHRLAHAIGGMVVDHVEGFEDLDAHAAFKRLQTESGCCCDPMEIDLGTLGKVTVQVARSIAFDEMDEGDFQQLVKAIYETIVKRYWPQMDADAVEQMALAYDNKREAA